MHPECHAFVEAAVKRCNLKTWKGYDILEFGSLDINGTVRDLFPGANSYHGVDMQKGPGVDEVDDAATWEPPHHEKYDVVLCLEVLEHAHEWEAIVRNMARHMDADSMAIITAACDPRPPHSAVDGRELDPSEFAVWPGEALKLRVEYYCNVDRGALEAVLRDNFVRYEVNTLPRGDVQALAWT